MHLTEDDVRVLLKMADVFVEDGSYLEPDECELLGRVLKKYPGRYKYLSYFLEHDEPPTAKRETKKKKATKKKVKKKKAKVKRKSPQKTCPECGAKVHVRKAVCPCGYEY